MGKLGEILSHPDELVPMVAMYMAARRAKVLPKDPSLAFCYDMLNRVSRSFAVVIQQLPPELRDAICVFYLVLRALDTVEDDMALDEDVKIPLLRCFHEKSYDRGWSMDCGVGEYQRLMQQYPLVTDAFLNLDPKFQDVIADICKQMGNGMADFIPIEVVSVEQYDLYCHYVAGLVGIGLSKLFASSGLESEEFYRLDDDANCMGLFLQKTNIIRDYLEDINEEPAPRMFWPREIWGTYAPELADFKEPENSVAAVGALNDMILNALSHIETCLAYMSKLRDPAVLRFCAIPQIMAIATLQLCYDNHKVFTGVVKMRRGEVAKIMHLLEDHADTLILFRKFSGLLGEKALKSLAAMQREDQKSAARAAAAGKAGKEEGDDAEGEGEGEEGGDDAWSEEEEEKEAGEVRARRAEVHKEVALACSRVVASCTQQLEEWQEGQVAARVAEAAAPVGTVGRAGLLLMAAVYAAYAWHIEEFRGYLGLPSGGASVGLDQVNRVLATMFLVYALWVGLTGKRV